MSNTIQVIRAFSPYSKYQSTVNNTAYNKKTTLQFTAHKDMKQTCGGAIAFLSGLMFLIGGAAHMFTEKVVDTPSCVCCAAGLIVGAIGAALIRMGIRTTNKSHDMHSERAEARLMARFFSNFRRVR